MSFGPLQKMLTSVVSQRKAKAIQPYKLKTLQESNLLEAAIEHSEKEYC